MRRPKPKFESGMTLGSRDMNLRNFQGANILLSHFFLVIAYNPVNICTKFDICILFRFGDKISGT